MYEKAINTYRYDDTDPQTQIYGKTFHESMPRSVNKLVAHTLDEVAAFGDGDYAAVRTQDANFFGVDKQTPLVVQHPIVQVGSQEDAYVTDEEAVGNGNVAVINIQTLVDEAGLSVDLEALDGNLLVIRQLVYNVEIATPRADGQINECVPQAALVPWEPSPESRTEIQPDSASRTESRQVYRDPDADPCPVCGARWLTHSYTYRPRQVRVRCSICENVRQQESP